MYIYITIFPLKEVLGVNGGPGSARCARARKKLQFGALDARARADPGTLSKEIELYIYMYESYIHITI